MSTPRPSLRRTREQWAALVDQQGASGLSVSRFCQQTGISYQSFLNWKKNLIELPESREASAGFVELITSGSSTCRTDIDAGRQWMIELDLGDGLQLRIARQ